MPARSSWKGYLKLSLVSVPVKAYTATSSDSRGIHLNQLHEECHSRISYKKNCPLHGEVSNDEIVSGYEFSKGQYVVVDTGELEKLRAESDKSINVDRFVAEDALDPIYESGRTYYLVPDGPVGQKAYALIREAMLDKHCHAIAQVVISNREQLVRLRPLGRLLAMTVLNYSSLVKQPDGFEDELVATETSAQELKLTGQLMDGLMDDNFDVAAYEDKYTQRLTQLIQAKVDGEELVAPPAVAEPQIINLMSALKASVDQIAPAKKAAPQAKKPARKLATGTAKKKATARKKKSG